jgi:hypothetical protein
MKPSLPLLRWSIAIVALVGSIHAAIADEASDAVEVLSKLWTATLDAKYQFVGEGKAYESRNMFVGDVKTYKMRHVFHNSKDGTREPDRGHEPMGLEWLPGRAFPLVSINDRLRGDDRG